MYSKLFFNCILKQIFNDLREIWSFFIVFTQIWLFLCNCEWFNAHLNVFTQIWLFLTQIRLFLRKCDFFDANLNASNQIWLYHSKWLIVPKLDCFEANVIVFRRKFYCFYANLIVFLRKLDSGSRRRRIFGLETDGRDPAPWHARLPHSAGLRMDGAHPGRDLGGHWG